MKSNEAAALRQPVLHKLVLIRAVTIINGIQLLTNDSLVQAQRSAQFFQRRVVVTQLGIDIA